MMTEQTAPRTTDPRQAIKFSNKQTALVAAKAIRWRSSSVVKVEIMGFRHWALSRAPGRFLTPAGYAMLKDQLVG